MASLLNDIFSSLFKKRSVAFLGRAGLNCYYNGDKFFVDSEMLVGPPSDIVIYSNNIYLIKGGNKYLVDDETRANVLDFLKTELEREKIKFEVS